MDSDQVSSFKKKLNETNRRGLATDIDETLSWTIGFWVREMQKLFGNPEHLTIDQMIKKYRYTQNVPYWQTKKAEEWMDKHRSANEVQKILPLINGANTAIVQVNRVVPIVCYITTRPQSATDGTREWLQKYGFPNVDIITRPEKIAFKEANRWKAEVLQQLYPQVIGMIDDNPDLVKELANDYKGTIYLYDVAEKPQSKLHIKTGKTWKDLVREIID